MQSTLKPKQADDPHDFLVVASDAVPVAAAKEQLSSLAHDAVRHPSDPQTQTGSGFAAAPPVPPVDTAFRPAAVNDLRVLGRRRWIGGPLRVFIALLLTAGVAAIAWQSYGDDAKQVIATWAPQFALTSWLPLEKLGLAAPPTPPAVQPGTAEAAAVPAPVPAPQAAVPAQAALAAAPAAAALSAESAQLIQSMAHDLATAGQEIEQLKAGIEQLKAGQQQMSRDIAKASEQNLRPRIAAPVPRPAVARPRKPMPYPPPQAAAVPPLPQAAAPYYTPRQAEPLPEATAQPQPDPELSSVPRPPMPMR
jgi:hypothetical protein